MHPSELFQENDRVEKVTTWTAPFGAEPGTEKAQLARFSPELTVHLARRSPRGLVRHDFALKKSLKGVPELLVFGGKDVTHAANC